MKRKPIKIDWDELDAVFSRPHDEIRSFLDLITGHVVYEGEGEEDDLDPEENYVAHPPSATAPLRDDTRLAVHPPDTTTKLEWMDRFMQSNVGQFGDALDDIREATKADDPAAAIGAVLPEHPELRDAWYLFRADRRHEQIERWLADNDVIPANAPPWA